MQKYALTIAITLITTVCHATIWRVNNDPTRDPDFTTVAAAIASASVMDGDTLHVEPSTTSYSGITLTRPLVIIGNGYFLTLNTGLQANTADSFIGTININQGADNTVILGIRATNLIIRDASNVTIAHCLLARVTFNSFTIPANGIELRKNFISGNTSSNSFTSEVTVVFENNIFSRETGFFANGINLRTNIRGLFRNNVVNGSLGNITISNFYFSNNIISQSSNASLGGSNNVIRNNLNAGSGLPPGDGNVNNVNMATVFTGDIGTGTGDARFQLAAASPALRAGESIGSVISPDCGAYGATDPYRSSGIPPVPSIYALTVPAAIPPLSTTMDITISTRSNN